MINTSSNITKLGSETCLPVIHKKYGCGSPDFLITALELDHETGVLTIYQNPNNCKSITIAELLQIQEIRNELSKVINGKVDKTYFLHTDKGIQGGGTFESELTLTIKPKDAHIDTTSEGLSIKKFTEVNTSGTVPSPEDSKKTEEYFLNAKGEWSKLGVLQFKGVIETSTTLSNLDTGDMYIIKDLEDPDKTVTVNGQIFLSTDVIIWDGQKFVDVGQVSIRVNLSLERGLETNIINNTAGKGITLLKADTAKAGLMSSTDKTNLDTLHIRKVVTSIQDVSQTGTTVSFTYTSIKTGETSSTIPIILPPATTLLAGVMTKDDKSNLDTLTSRVVVTGVTGTQNDNSYVLKANKSNSSFDTLTIKVVGVEGANAGLMTKADKDKLDSLQGVNLQSDWTEVTDTASAYIRNKPTVLGSSASFDGLLVPKPGSLTGSNLFLNINGSWQVVKSTPPITYGADEPSGDNAVEGSIWIIP